MTAFSVIMPAYNYARYLPEAIGSVLASSFEDFELIVIDDCSTDNTREILESIDDPRVVVLSNETNSGPCVTSNRGLEVARGDFIGVLNADDRYHRDFLLRIYEAFSEAGPELGAVGTYLLAIDADGQQHPQHPGEADFNHPVDLQDPAVWVWQVPFVGSAMARRSVYDDLGGFAPDIPSAMDWDLWIRALAAGYRFHVIPEALFDWRVHGANITNRDVSVTVEGYSLISQRHFHPYLISQGREDLLAENVAGFLTHPAVLSGEVTFAARILDRVLAPLSSEQRALAVQRAGAELLRLREYYEGEAARVDYLRGLSAAAQERADEREYELNAALDRLSAAEADRRVAQAEVAMLKNSLVRRAGRKVKNRVRR